MPKLNLRAIFDESEQAARDAAELTPEYQAALGMQRPALSPHELLMKQSLSVKTSVHFRHVPVTIRDAFVRASQEAGYTYPVQLFYMLLKGYLDEQEVDCPELAVVIDKIRR